MTQDQAAILEVILKRRHRGIDGDSLLSGIKLPRARFDIALVKLWQRRDIELTKGKWFAKEYAPDRFVRG